MTAGFLLLAWCVHELGHWLGLAALGFRGRLRCVGMLGVAVELPPACQGWREAGAALAGPGANLLMLAAAQGLGLEEFWEANFVMAAVNLLPFLPLDGGKALRGLFSGCFGWLGVSRLLLLWGRGLALAFAGLIYWFGLARWLLLGAVWLYLLAYLEERQLPYLLGTRLAACLEQSWRPLRRIRLRGDMADWPLYLLVARMAPGWRNVVVFAGRQIEGDALIQEWLRGRGQARIGDFALSGGGGRNNNKDKGK